MSGSAARAGFLRNGLPYNRVGRGPRVAVVFQGLLFENKPLTGLSAALLLEMYRFLGAEYTTYVLARRRGLPGGYSLRDMADDYAEAIRGELGGPVDVIGTSTGGSIAQHFAADHPELLRRLVLHSSAYALGPTAKQAQLEIGRLAWQRRWPAAYAALLRLIVPPGRWSPALIALGALLLSLGAPRDPSDLAVTVEAEDGHNFRRRLGAIRAPTLVVAGEQDACYPAELICATAAGIPGARLILYPGVGHPAAGRRFERDVLSFLREGVGERTLAAAQSGGGVGAA